MVATAPFRVQHWLKPMPGKDFSAFREARFLCLGGTMLMANFHGLHAHQNRVR